MAERLRSYLVPAAVVVIEAWPLTVDSELDIRALPAPAHPVDRETRAAGGCSPGACCLARLLDVRTSQACDTPCLGNSLFTQIGET